MAKGTWGQIVGFLGVVLSLAFVGLEIRQNNTIARASALNDLAVGQREWLLAVAADGELAELWDRWVIGQVSHDSLAPGELSRVLGLAQSYVGNFENVFLQAENGVAGEEALSHYHFRGSAVVRSDNFISFWQSQRNRHHPAFVAAFEEEYPQLRP